VRSRFRKSSSRLRCSSLAASWASLELRFDIMSEIYRAMLQGATHAVRAAASPSSSIIRSRIANFCALPVMVIGISATKRT